MIFLQVTALFCWNNIFLRWQLKSPQFFLITSANIDQGQNNVFLLIFSSSHSFLTCGCLGTRRNGWDRDVLWEELLAENYKLLVAQAFYPGFCLHHHCQSYWHHHSLHLVKSSGWNLWGHDFGLLSSWENHFDWWMSNLSKYISSAPNGTITKVLHHKCFCNRKFFKPRWSFFPFLVKTFHQETILGKVSR